MASDGIPDNIPVTRLVQGSRARTSDSFLFSSGKAASPSGEVVRIPADPQVVPAPAAQPVPSSAAAQPVPSSPAPQREHAPDKPDADELVAQLSKHAGNSGRPDQFRLDRSTGRRIIQQTNADSGKLVAEYSESEFPALAQGLSHAGLLINVKA